MNNINLDINTYTIEELDKLLNIKPPYSKEDIVKTKEKLVKTIIKSNINQIKKEELLIFLDNIQNKLSNNLLQIDADKFNDVRQYDARHYIIKNKNNDETTTLENNKKINKSIIKRTYTIDSLFRQNYDNLDNESHDYIISLPETITKAITMSISSVEIPLTYHNISEELNNNVFEIQVINTISDDISFSQKIELTTGLYEARSVAKTGNSSKILATEISSEINNQMRNINTQGSTPNDISFITDLSNGLSFNIDPRSGFGFFKFSDTSASIITSDHNIKINFDINNQKAKENCRQNFIYQKLGWQLGYRTKDILLSSENDISYVEFSRSPCYINYPRYIYIAIDDFQSSSRNYYSIASDNVIAPNIIGRINILSLLEEKTAFKQAAAPGDFMYNQKHVREYFGPTDINKLKISLLDEYGRPFTLNNMDWSFILTFECFYN